LVDITTLHEQHFKAVDQKLDDVSSKFAMPLQINKVHFAKMTDFMEQKFSHGGRHFGKINQDSLQQQTFARNPPIGRSCGNRQIHQ
jgi:hypothetical protein